MVLVYRREQPISYTYNWQFCMRKTTERNPSPHACARTNRVKIQENKFIKIVCGKRTLATCTNELMNIIEIDSQVVCIATFTATKRRRLYILCRAFSFAAILPQYHE